MISKLINLLLVYVLCLINLMFLFLPFAIFFLPVVAINEAIGIKLITRFYLIGTFAISIVMLLYIALDYIFGFTITKYTTFRIDTKSYRNQEFKKYYAYMDRAFKEVRKKFLMGNVELYIKKSNEINAFAIGSVRRNAIVVTTNLLNLLISKSHSQEEFFEALRGVIAHEMSHLINKDFLPGMIISCNQRATDLTAKILNLFFSIILWIFGHFPIVGGLFKRLSLLIHIIISKLVHFVLDHIVMPIYKVCHIVISKQTEFRCDKESALAFGSHGIGLTLEFLGVDSYNSIFAHHPSVARRLNNIKNVNKKEAYFIFPNHLTNLLNLATISLFCLLPFATSKALGIDNLIQSTYELLKILYINSVYFVKFCQTVWNITSNIIDKILY